MSDDRKLTLKGVVCAAVTPLEKGKLHVENHQRHIKTLAEEGCDGVLLLGTTGEGPSIGLAERAEIIEATLAVSGEMKIMVGTGLASLPDTITATRQAFDLKVDAVVVIPPFYFKKVSDEGLVAYYRQLFDEAVPDDGLLLAYHIPQMTAVPISYGLLERLLVIAGDRMAGVKDSSGDLDHTLELCRRFPQLRIFVGNDKLLLQSLQAGAAGCITAGANVLAPLAANVYRAYTAGEDAGEHQALLTAARGILEGHPPFPPAMKGLLENRYGTSGWEVRPPLDPLPESGRQALWSALNALDLPEQYRWLKQAAV
jgi:4-hydroxy-tetrahydrodipicolinate synthase